jgi:hypothetical protein
MTRKARNYHVHIHVNDEITGFLTGNSDKRQQPGGPNFELYRSSTGIQDQQELDKTADLIAAQARAERAKAVRVKASGAVEWQGSRGLTSVNLYHGRRAGVTKEDLEYMVLKLKGLGLEVRISTATDRK